MKELPISRGLVTLVDDDVFEWASRNKWSVHPVTHTSYAYRKRNKKNVYLHREILNAPTGMEVDHLDGNGLNNRKENLRLVSHAGNAAARQTKRAGKTSFFRGVSRVRKGKPWESRIKVEQRCIHLGTFDIEEQAARAYDAAAVKYFGPLASPNFP